MVIRASLRKLLSLVLVLGSVPVMAGTTDTLAVEARVERLLAQLVNDERFSHLPIAANYEHLRAYLLEQSCLVSISAAPCAPSDRIHHGRTMTSEFTPEQAEVLDQLLFTIHSASASVAETPQRLITAAE